MSLTSYQAAPPRVFEEGHNAFASTPAQLILAKIFTWIKSPIRKSHKRREVKAGMA
jgi:hypothetical protein